MSEQWRPAVGLPGYQVSDLGRVRTLDRLDLAGKRRRSRELTQRANHRGYLKVMVSVDGRRSSRSVHRLVLEAFAGPCPPGMETRHLNGIKTDNRLPNLAWGTARENALDNVRLGVHPQASKTHCNHGHPFTPENTINFGPGGRWRACRPCRRHRTAVYDRSRRNRFLKEAP